MCLDYDEEMNLRGIVLLFWGFGFFACSSAPKQEERSLKKLLLYNLALRRPLSVGAKPGAVRGEKEFQVTPKLNAQFDCMPLRRLYRDVDFFKLEKCFKAVEKSGWKQTVYFELQKSVAPYWKRKEPHLEDDDPFEEQPDAREVEIPQCIKEVLDKIPIPREIFFQSNEEGSLNCYSARIGIDEDSLLDSKLQKTELTLAFPLERVPSTEREMKFLLATWSLAPFFNAEGQIKSKLVPSHVCGKCIGEANLFLEADPLPPLWP